MRLVKLYQVLGQSGKAAQYRNHVSDSYDAQAYGIYLSRSAHRPIKK